MTYMMPDPSAFHGRDETKAMFLARVRTHRAAGNIVQGSGWDKGRGCSVGCTLESYDHQAYEPQLGIPRLLAGLQDGVFERLSEEEAIAFTEQFLEAIPVGADTNQVYYRFVSWLLKALLEQLKLPPTGDAGKALQGVIDLCDKVAQNEPPLNPEWEAAARAATRAATASPDSTVTSAANVATAAAYAAAAAYFPATANIYANTAARVARSARTASARLMRDKLLQLLAEAPVPQPA